MPFVKSLSAQAGPSNIFTRYPEIYGPWSVMSEAMMNGYSPLSQGQRELILAYAAGLAGCEFVCIAHSEVAYARGIEDGLVDRLLREPDNLPVDQRLRPLLTYVRKLTLTPCEISQTDVDQVFSAGWDDHALHDAIAVTARAAFMLRLAQGYGFTPMTRERAADRARQRIEHGYVKLYSAFREPE